jgi:hypothetical protein
MAEESASEGAKGGVGVSVGLSLGCCWVGGGGHGW